MRGCYQVLRAPLFEAAKYLELARAAPEKWQSRNLSRVKAEVIRLSFLFLFLLGTKASKRRTRSFHRPPGAVGTLDVLPTFPELQHLVAREKVNRGAPEARGCQGAAYMTGVFIANEKNVKHCTPRSCRSDFLPRGLEV